MYQGEGFKLTIIIPARLNSIRINHKPLLRINGKTLVHNAVNIAKDCRYQDSIVITSESDTVLSLFKTDDKVKLILTSDKPLTGTERLVELLDIVDSDYYMLLPCDIFPITGMILDHIVESVIKNKIDLGCLVTSIKEDELYSFDDVKMLLDKDNYALNFIREIPDGIFNRYDIETKLVKQLGIYIYSKYVLEKFRGNNYDLLEVVNNNESYRFIHNSIRMKAIFTSADLFTINSKSDIMRVKGAGNNVQYSE